MRSIATRWTRYHGMLALVDPSATPKNRCLDDDTFNRLTGERRAELTEDEWIERHERLECLINALIEASIKLLPRDVRRASEARWASTAPWSEAAPVPTSASAVRGR